MLTIGLITVYALVGLMVADLLRRALSRGVAIPPSGQPVVDWLNRHFSEQHTLADRVTLNRGDGIVIAGTRIFEADQWCYTTYDDGVYRVLSSTDHVVLGEWREEDLCGQPSSRGR